MALAARAVLTLALAACNGPHLLPDHGHLSLGVDSFGLILDDLDHRVGMEATRSGHIRVGWLGIPIRTTKVGSTSPCATGGESRRPIVKLAAFELKRREAALGSLQATPSAIERPEGLASGAVRYGSGRRR